MEQSEAAFSVRHLIKCYGSKRAVNDVSFTIARGEIFGLLGPNGAGKTTIISTLVTLQKPTCGSMHIFGIDLAKEPRKVKKYLGFVPQELINHGFFTVIEILRYHAAYYGVRVDKAYLKHLLEKLQLTAYQHHLVNHLSGGMKRRPLIAKALLHRPKLLLLDEPTTGVDVELRTSPGQFLSELTEEGIAMLLTTHDLEQAERLMDHWASLHSPQIMDLHYESLVQNPNYYGELLTSFCGLNWTEEMLQPADGDQNSYTFSELQSRQPVSTARVGRWQAYAEYLPELNQA